MKGIGPYGYHMQFYHPQFCLSLFKVFWSAEPFFQKRFCIVSFKLRFIGGLKGRRDVVKTIVEKMRVLW